MSRAAGLTATGRAVLRQLVRHDGRQPDYVVDGRAVSRLESQGFVKAEVVKIPPPATYPEGKTRHKLYIVITAAGRAVLAELAAVRETLR